jgi:molybdate transport system substrate-binding protein
VGPMNSAFERRNVSLGEMGEKVKYLLSSVVLAVLALGISSSARAQSEIALLAPTPMRAAMLKLLPVFQASTFEGKKGYTVKITVNNLLFTKQQMAKGEPFDVAIVMPPYPEMLASGNVVADSAIPLASLTEAIAVRMGAPRPDVSTAAMVKKMLLACKSVSYSDPTTTTSGIAALEVFKKLGITEQMKPKSMVSVNGGIAQLRVGKGEAEISLAYLSDLVDDARRQPGLDVLGLVPKSIAPDPTPMVVILSSHAKDPVGAEALANFLASPDAEAVYKREGMLPAHYASGY